MERINPSEIERKNLEAHVEICSERFSNLNDENGAIHTRLDQLQTENEELNKSIQDVKTTINDNEKITRESIENVKDELTSAMSDLKETITKKNELMKDNMLKWGVTIILTLLGFIGNLVLKYIPFFKSN